MSTRNEHGQFLARALGWRLWTAPFSSSLCFCLDISHYADTLPRAYILQTYMLPLSLFSESRHLDNLHVVSPPRSVRSAVVNAKAKDKDGDRRCTDILFFRFSRNFTMAQPYDGSAETLYKLSLADGLKDAHNMYSFLGQRIFFLYPRWHICIPEFSEWKKARYRAGECVSCAHSHSLLGPRLRHKRTGLSCTYLTYHFLFFPSRFFLSSRGFRKPRASRRTKKYMQRLSHNERKVLECSRAVVLNSVDTRVC